MAFQSLYQLQSNFYLQTVQDSYESLLGVESAAAFVATLALDVDAHHFGLEQLVHLEALQTRGRRE